jgi:hypothetical protein
VRAENSLSQGLPWQVGSAKDFQDQGADAAVLLFMSANRRSIWLA